MINKHSSMYGWHVADAQQTYFWQITYPDYIYIGMPVLNEMSYLIVLVINLKYQKGNWKVTLETIDYAQIQCII